MSIPDRLAAVLGAERFVQEITTTAALQNPHILPLFDSGEADGFLYSVTPFIDGETLREKLDRAAKRSSATRTFRSPLPSTPITGMPFHDCAPDIRR